jgi:hypothetical protein
METSILEEGNCVISNEIEEIIWVLSRLESIAITGETGEQNKTIVSAVTDDICTILRISIKVLRVNHFGIL